MLIAFLSDFGDSPFVGIVKGVIKSVNPEVEIIDLCHNVTPFDVFEGAIILASAVKYFPEETVFLGVVDPGVGSDRRAIIVRSQNYWFVVPDNGLISLVRDREKLIDAFEIDRSKFERVSDTFHARDIFGPVAGAIASGVSPLNFGTRLPLEVLTYFNLPAVDMSETKEHLILKGEVIYIDRFGNLVTNISSEDLELLLKGRDREALEVKLTTPNETYTIRGLSRFYDSSRELVAVIDSFGYLEIAVPQGNAAERLRATKGNKVTARIAKS